MDRYDRIIYDVQRRTDSGSIRWAVVNANSYSDVVLNPHRVVRAFKADYEVGQRRRYDLLFVERKVDFHDDIRDVTEGYGFELIVLDRDGQLVLSLYDGLVDKDDLLKLSGLIDEHNDRVKTFFDAFDEQGIA